MDTKKERKARMKVTCPACGYEMPITHEPDAECTGVFVTCKGRNCKKIFEVKIREGTQYK